MNTNRNTARIVGALFIIGTVAGVLSAVVAGPILSDSNYLISVSANSKIIIGGLLVLIMGFALAMVPVMMFPIFKKYNQALALGSVVFRGALEAVMYIAMVITWLLLLTVSQEYIKAGMPDASHFHTLGVVLINASDQINAILEIVFSIGSLMIYYLFYQSKLVPRWLSIWGLVGTILYLTAGLSHLFAINLELLVIPLALLEMVLAVWLIVKGFNTSTITSEPA